MCELQFFSQITEGRSCIHEGVVGEPRAETEAEDKTIKFRDRIQFALCVKDSVKNLVLFIGQSIFYLRQVIRDVSSQLIRTTAGFDRPRLRIDVAEEKFFDEGHFAEPPFDGRVGSFAFSSLL